MRLSKRQKALLHMAAQEVAIPQDLRREVQQRIGGSYSAADRTWTREGFIAVMAFYESRSPHGKLRGFTVGYWQGQDQLANPTDLLVHRCGEEARRLGLSAEQLDAFLAGPHMSSGVCETVTTAPAYWLRRLLQGLIEIQRRKRRNRK